ncbi:MAG TPA: hypothetical protein V6C57_19635 [Coleofasciculaceae cyanobacterium]
MIEDSSAFGISAACFSGYQGCWMGDAARSPIRGIDVASFCSLD